MTRARTIMTVLLMALLVSVWPTPAATAEQQTQVGLVNVAVGDIKTGDILSNNNVTVEAAVGVIANVCGTTINAAVLSEQLNKTGNYRCQGKTQFVQITKAKQ
jgi:hypothetical protein